MRSGPILAGIVLMWLPLIAAPAGPRRVLLGLDLYMPVPEDNPLTEASISLGRRLFFDTRLSRDGSIACSTCHVPARAFADGRALSRGVGGRVGRRNAPAILNRGYGAAFFWDGRAASLEEQVLGPIEDPAELGSEVDEVVRRLAADRHYAPAFRDAFAREVSRDDLARALASYVRSIQAGDAPVDRFLAGDANALSTQAQAGLRVFRGKANCTACHLGPTFSDERFHNTGVAWASEDVAEGYRDAGRFAVSGAPGDRGAFKTPTLREIARTAPYMHDGSVATLEDVIAFYDRGGRPNPTLDPEIRPLQLSAQEKGFLLAFLRSLSGRIADGSASVRPR
ncbi:MAG: cytochrome c peroxidase [Vicinamibacterales bacterium]